MLLVHPRKRSGTLRLVWDEPTRRETEHVVGKIPPLVGTDLSGLFRPDGQFDGPTHPVLFGHGPDPDDRKFAALAAAAGAVLLTNDRHLLDGRPHPGLVVLTPGEFVHLNPSGSSDPRERSRLCAAVTCVVFEPDRPPYPLTQPTR